MELPPDVSRKIAMELPLHDLMSYCQTSSALRRVCDDNYFGVIVFNRTILIPQQTIDSVNIDYMKNLYFAQRRARLDAELEHQPEQISDEIARVEDKYIKDRRRELMFLTERYPIENAYSHLSIMVIFNLNSQTSPPLMT